MLIHIELISQEQLPNLPPQHKWNALVYDLLVSERANSTCLQLGHQFCEPFVAKGVRHRLAEVGKLLVDALVDVWGEG